MAEPARKKFGVRDTMQRFRTVQVAWTQRACISIAHPPPGNAFRVVSPTIKFKHPPSFNLSDSSAKRADTGIFHQSTSPSSVEHGRHLHHHLSPLRLHSLPSSRPDLRYSLHADHNPSHLPTTQNPRLVSDTHSDRRSLYAALSLSLAHLPKQGPTD